MFAGLGRDIRYGLRAWRQRPWFTAAIIGMLVLGIAATTSIFAVAYALPSEAGAGQDREALVSFSLWRSRFGGSARVLGRKLRLDGRFYTIIGVMPQRFQAGTVGGDAVWIPAAFTAQELATNGPRDVQVTARLDPAVTWLEEQPRLAAFAAGLHLRFRGAPVSFVGITLPEARQSLARSTPLLALLAAVGLVLLIACANVAGRPAVGAQ